MLNPAIRTALADRSNDLEDFATTPIAPNSVPAGDRIGAATEETPGVISSNDHPTNVCRTFAMLAVSVPGWIIVRAV